jgi:polygalacturonase
MFSEGNNRGGGTRPTPHRNAKKRRRTYYPALCVASAISIAALTGAAPAGAAVGSVGAAGAAGSAGARSSQVNGPAGLTTPGTYTCSATGSSATSQVPVTGAVAGGTVDDSAAIQNAIKTAGAKGGGIVSLPAGTYMINSHLVMKNNVELTGAGPSTVIKAGPNFLSTTGTGGGYPIISTAGASNTTIANLTADQSGNTLNANVANRLWSYVVEGRTSTNVLVNGVTVINPFTYSIAMVASSNFCVENSTVNATATLTKYDQLDGIHIMDSNNGRVINNVIQSGDDGLAAHTMGAPVYNVLFANNLVDGGAVASGLQFAIGNPSSIYGITVVNNDFYGAGIGIHTGYYGSNPTGSVYSIQISNNYVYNLLYGVGSLAIQMGLAGQRGAIKSITVSNTLLCNVGAIQIQSGTGNSVTGTTTTTSCG